MVSSATSPDGTQLELWEHDGSYSIMINRIPLMSTRMHHSEEELARLGCRSLPAKPRILVGGLGMGFTLRAVLDLLPEDGRVDQVELVPEVVEWNRGPLADFAGSPLEDPRVRLVMKDVRKVIAKARGQYAAILLDVDNGPSVQQREKNSGLYSSNGIKQAHRALIPGGFLAIWAAGHDDRSFPEHMARQGFEASLHKVYARPNRKGGRHAIYLGQAV